MSDNQRDTLLGAEAIFNFVVTEVVDPSCGVTQKAVQHWIDREILPTGRFGRQITASKSVIRAALSGQAPAPPPVRPTFNYRRR